MRTGERQAQRYRELYVDAILSQEVGWFDQCGANGLATQVANLTGKVSTFSLLAIQPLQQPRLRDAYMESIAKELHRETVRSLSLIDTRFSFFFFP